MGRAKIPGFSNQKYFWLWFSIVIKAFILKLKNFDNSAAHGKLVKPCIQAACKLFIHL